MWAVNGLRSDLQIYRQTWQDGTSLKGKQGQWVHNQLFCSVCTQQSAVLYSVRSQNSGLLFRENKECKPFFENSIIYILFNQIIIFIVLFVLLSALRNGHTPTKLSQIKNKQGFFIDSVPLSAFLPSVEIWLIVLPLNNRPFTLRYPCMNIYPCLLSHSPAAIHQPSAGYRMCRIVL